MRTQIFEDKRLNVTTQQCVHHMKTILNLVHIDISKDETIYAPLICNTCYSKLQYFVRNTATERSLSLHCYAQLKTVIFGTSLIPCIPSSQCPLSLSIPFLWERTGNEKCYKYKVKCINKNAKL